MCIKEFHEGSFWDHCAFSQFYILYAADLQIYNTFKTKIVAVAEHLIIMILKLFTHQLVTV